MKNIVALIFFILIIVYIAKFILRLNGAVAKKMTSSEPGE